MLHGRLMSFKVGGGEVRTYVTAFGPDGSHAFPREEAVGLIPTPGSIILDRTFAKEAGLSRGEFLEYNDHRFKVAEIRHVGNILVTQFAFVHPRDFRKVFGIPETANFFLVALEPGVEASDDLVGRIEAKVENSAAYSTDDFASRASDKGTGDFLPIIRVIMVISFIVGLSVLSLTIYTATVQRAREYAVLKVLGATPVRLYRTVISQSSIIAMLGFGGGVALAFGFNSVAEDVVPQFITYIRWRDVAVVLGVAAAMSFIACYLPVNHVARVDPASVFRA